MLAISALFTKQATECDPETISSSGSFFLHLSTATAHREENLHILGGSINSGTLPGMASSSPRAVPAEGRAFINPCV